MKKFKWNNIEAYYSRDLFAQFKNNNKVKFIKMNNISFKKKFILDFILSFLSTVIPIVILQLVIYPVTSRILNSDDYGLMVNLLFIVYVDFKFRRSCIK